MTQDRQCESHSVEPQSHPLLLCCPTLSLSASRCQQLFLAGNQLTSLLHLPSLPHLEVRAQESAPEIGPRVQEAENKKVLNNSKAVKRKANVVESLCSWSKG